MDFLMLRYIKAHDDPSLFQYTYFSDNSKASNTGVLLAKVMLIVLMMKKAFPHRPSRPLSSLTAR